MAAPAQMVPVAQKFYLLGGSQHSPQGGGGPFRRPRCAVIRFSELTTLTKKEHMTFMEAVSRSFVSATAKEVARYDISSGERSRTIKITSVYSMQGKNRRNKKEASSFEKMKGAPAVSGGKSYPPV